MKKMSNLWYQRVLLWGSITANALPPDPSWINSLAVLLNILMWVWLEIRVLF